jgi:hypothetical protein
MAYDAQGNWQPDAVASVNVPITQFAEMARNADVVAAVGETARQQQAAAQAELERQRSAASSAILDIDQRGQSKYGTERWNAAVQSMRREEGGDLSGYEAMLTAHQPKHVVDHVMTMAADPDYRTEFKNASAARRNQMIEEHARNRASYGHLSHTPEPKTPQEFRATGGDGLEDDAAWSKAFDRAYGTGRRYR